MAVDHANDHSGRSSQVATCQFSISTSLVIIAKDGGGRNLLGEKDGILAEKESSSRDKVRVKFAKARIYDQRDYAI